MNKAKAVETMAMKLNKEAEIDTLRLVRVISKMKNWELFDRPQYNAGLDAREFAGANISFDTLSGYKMYLSLRISAEDFASAAIRAEGEESVRWLWEKTAEEIRKIFENMWNADYEEDTIRVLNEEPDEEAWDRQMIYTDEEDHSLYTSRIAYEVDYGNKYKKVWQGEEDPHAGRYFYNSQLNEAKMEMRRKFIETEPVKKYQMLPWKGGFGK